MDKWEADKIYWQQEEKRIAEGRASAINFGGEPGEREVLTPSGLSRLFGKHRSTVTQAITRGHLEVVFDLKGTRLIRLPSAIAFWGEPHPARLGQLRADGVPLHVEGPWIVMDGLGLGSQRGSNMNTRQRTVCAIALWADGWSHQQIAKALNVTEEEATELTARGAAEQGKGTMGYMKSGKPPLARDPEAREEALKLPMVKSLGLVVENHADYE